MAAEKQFENKVKKYLAERNDWYLKYWGGGGFTKSGVPDLIVCDKGLFNVPYNNSRRTSVDESIIMEVSKYLQGITIMDGDFEEACEGAGQGDFVFIDSPYAPLNPTSFESYTKEGFDIESHRRLSNLFDKLTNRGCYCMLTNHNTELINELYSGKGYRRDVVSVKRMINSDASKRVGEEIIICNY